MRNRLLVLAVIYCAGARWSGAQPAVVSHVSGAAANSFTTAAINTTGATALVACATGLPGYSLTDSASNTWTTAITKTNNHITTLYYVTTPNTSASHTFTITQTAKSATLQVIAASGTGPLDGAAVGNDTGGNSGLTSVQPGSITPAQANDGFYTCFGVDTAGSYTINGIFTVTDQSNFNGGCCFGGAMAWATEGNTTAQNPTWSESGSGTRLTATMLALSPPVTPPVISAVAYTNLSSHSAVFTWTTDTATSSQVLCADNGGGAGPYSTYVTQVSDPVNSGVSSAWGVTAHRLGVNLPSSYSGHCVVKSVASNTGNAQSADQVVTTPAAPTVTAPGIATVTRRYNLTSGFTDATHGGFSGDISFQVMGADGAWYQQNNDSNGRSASASTYCCVGHFQLSKWTAQTGPRSMLLVVDPGGSNAINWYGGGSNNQTITSGTCAANVASIVMPNWGYTVPVGTPIYVTGSNPAGYNVSGATVSASSQTTLSYTGTCGSSAYVSGGTITLWNDGNHQQSVGITSVNGLMCIDTFRSGSGQYIHRVCSTDYFAHSFVDANVVNPAAGSQTVVPWMDLPLPTQACYTGNCTSSTTVILMPLMPCQDYGGANQTAFTCGWDAGDENYIYMVSPPASGAGYTLLRMPYQDYKRMNGIDGIGGTTIQEFTGSSACDDSGLLASNWTSTISRTHSLNSGLGTFGNTPNIIAVPDFHDFILTNWINMNVNASQSAGATMYSLCGRPWGVATAIGGVGRDETDIQYFPTFGQLIPGTYSLVSSSPLRATIDFRQSGSYLNQTTNPSTNQYGSNWYRVSLSSAWSGQKGYGGPRFSYSGGQTGTFPSANLDVFYDFSDISGASVVSNSSPNDTLGTYKATTPQNTPILTDRYGEYATGYVGTCPGAGSTNCTYGATVNTPYGWYAATPYVTSNGDFTMGLVWSHQDTSFGGPPSGECVVNRAKLSVCRNGTTANSWIVTVGATTATVSDTCDGTSPSFCGLIVSRTGGTAKIYKAATIAAASYPLTVLGTISDGTALGADALVIGAQQVSNGTVSTSNSGANTAVVGSSTTFVAGQVGETFTIGGQSGSILTFTDSTHITVTGNFGTLAGQSYTAGTLGFQGWISQLFLYSTGSTDNNLVILANAMKARALQRGITIQ